MCGRYAQYAPVTLTEVMRAELADIDSGFDLAGQLDARESCYNIAPGTAAPIVALSGDKLALRELRWGLVPGWAKDERIGMRAINARAETVDSKPMFRAAFKKRRALVPASGYFEWRQEQGGKQPYFIHAPAQHLLLFAGLWSAWRRQENGGVLKTFTILTQKAGPVTGEIHDRQPVIVAPKYWQDWLGGGPGRARALLDFMPAAELAYHPVGRAVGSPRNQGSKLIEPHH